MFLNKLLSEGGAYSLIELELLECSRSFIDYQLTVRKVIVVTYLY